MEIGVDNSPETVGVAMEFPAVDGAELSSPPTLPPRLRRRLTETKASSPSVEEIESKLRDADLRRQKFYEHLSSKARPKPRSPSQSANEENLGQRLQAKLLAAEQKRSSILAKAQLRLAKLNQLRQAARTGVEVRVKKECAELGTKVELRVRKAETNRMRILKAYRQRRATLKERSSQSLIRRVARESKYKELVCAAICQKRAAAEKKRLELLEADIEKAHSRLLQVRRVAKSVSQRREIERRRLRESLEDKLQRAKRQRAEYLLQRARLHSSVGVSWTKKKQGQGDKLSRKLARCWRKFLKQRTTLDLAKNYSVLNINEGHVKSMPFEQFALLIETPSTLQTTKALLERLEIRYKALMSTASSISSHGKNDIDHLLKRVASPSKRTTPRNTTSSIHAKKLATARAVPKSSVKLSRYQVRVVLCAYMILGHPDAVFSGQGECETALAESAKKFIQEFELLISIILDGPLQNSGEDSNAALPRLTFRSQLVAFDSAWCSYLNSFVVWKVKDAESLEDDLVRAACQMEMSMMQKCKLTPEGDNTDLTHDMKAIQNQVTDDQKLWRETVMHLSGDEGIERMQGALSDTRTNYFEAKENGSPIGSPVAHVLPSSSLTTATTNSDKRNKSEEPSRAVRALFKGDASKPLQKDVGSSASSSKSLESQLYHSGEKLSMENELIVNEFVHGQQYSSANSLNGADEDQTVVKVRQTMEKAFWDGITDSIRQDNYDRVVELMKEVRDELCEMAPQSWKQDIIEAIDVVILSQLLNSGSLDMEYLGKMMEFALVSLQKLSAPANEMNLKDAHQKVLRELADIFQADDSNHSHAIALVKGLRFVLEQIQALKQEISNARIKIMEPLLKGPAGLEYLGKAFAKRFGPPSDALTRLPLTMRWLSFLGSIYDQDWNEHKQTLSSLQDGSFSDKVLPSTALRTGGNFSSGVRASSPVSKTNAADNQYPECKGEKRDFLVRLGLLKLVSDVYGVTHEELPETLKLNFLRLRVVQAQLQKIIVTATSTLVLRQTLVMEQMILSPEDMEITIQKCTMELLQILDTNENAGLEEIVEVLTKTTEGFDKSNDPTKTESRRLVMARMLRKSVQADDSVFIKVSRAVYLATRGVVLGGSGNHGRQLAEMALRQVGAAVLTDRVVEAGRVLGVMGYVTERVHGPWYDRLIKKV